MSDEVKDEFIDMEQIPKGSEIPIIITTNMYIRIQQLLFEGLPYKDLERRKAYDRMRDRKDYRNTIEK